MASEGDERASVAAVEPQEELGWPRTKLKEPGSGFLGTWEGLETAEL